MVLGKTIKPIADLVNLSWKSWFMISNNIALRCQTGKYQLMSHVREEIERGAAYCSAELARDLSSGALCEDNIANADETHFAMNEENELTLGFRGEECVKYLDDISGGERMAMMFQISGGVRARLEAPMMILKNKDSNYHITVLPDDVPGVCSRI